MLGTAHTIIRNFGTARILLERAVSIDPNSAWAWSRFGWLETYSDRPELAMEHFEKAGRLSPFDPLIFNNYVGMASAMQGAGEFDKSIELFQRALQERPHAYWIYRSLAHVLVGAGRMDEARKAYDTLIEHYPDLTLSKVREAMVFSPQFMDTMIDALRQLGMSE